MIALATDGVVGGQVKRDIGKNILRAVRQKFEKYRKKDL